MHFLSIWNVFSFSSCGTIFKTHFDFFPYNGSVQPFSFGFSIFLNLNSFGLSSVHRALKCSYLSLTSQNFKFDFLFNILFTNSCKLYTYLEKLSRSFISAIVKGNCFKFVVRFILQYLHGNTFCKLIMKLR